MHDKTLPIWKQKTLKTVLVGYSTAKHVHVAFDYTFISFDLHTVSLSQDCSYAKLTSQCRNTSGPWLLPPLRLTASFLATSLTPYNLITCNHQVQSPRLYVNYAMLMRSSMPVSYTLFINGCQFKGLLYVFKIAQLTSFETNNSFELSTQKRG